MSWDPLQREVLAALGHVLYRAPGGDTEPQAVPADALSLAVLRAAGRGPDAADAARLCREWGVPARVRTAGAKRALWPKVRAARRKGS